MPGTELWPIKIDPSQIGQIWANLCVKARDAIDGVGKIVVETGNDLYDLFATASGHRCNREGGKRRCWETPVKRLPPLLFGIAVISILKPSCARAARMDVHKKFGPVHVSFK